MPGQIAGVVVSAGKMMKTVKVRVAKQAYNAHIRKNYRSSINHLVADPNSSLREGDVVSISPGWRTSKHVRHVVTSIIAPFGPAIDERPPIPSEEERLAKRAEKRTAKDERRRIRREEGVAASRVMKGKKTDQKLEKPIEPGRKPQDVVKEARRKSQTSVEKKERNEEESAKVEERVEGDGKLGGEVATGRSGRTIDGDGKGTVAEEAPKEPEAKQAESASKGKGKAESNKGILGRVANWWGTQRSKS
ncbi:MAG: hypothetical protein M1835_002876 [Candelina submexicana]|nr:MAG: hypothetical protein M1835_002876 [Candelina submexicana]